MPGSDKDASLENGGAPRPSGDRPLESWKEIAQYLKRDVRTVQRWEKKEGLPIRRHHHLSRASVYAYAAELDEWWQARAGQIEAAENTEQPAPDGGAARPTALGWRHYGVPILGIAIVLFAIGAFKLIPRPSVPAVPQRPEKPMLVVLPFENLSGDPGQDYLSDGLTEELISQLSRSWPEQLGVIARTSAMHYKRQDRTIEQIRHELGVDYAVEGSIRRQGDRLRITVQLIQARGQAHLWTSSYDRTSRDVIAVQDEIAQDVSAVIRSRLGLKNEPHQRRAVEITPEAYQAYLQGLYFWNKRTEPDLQEAVRYFDRAIRLQPDFARAHAGLANSYVLLGGWAIPGREAWERSTSAAQRSLELNERSSDAHLAAAAVAMRFAWDSELAEREFRRSLELDPGNALAHHWYGYHLMLSGRFAEAEGEIERAQRLDPLSLSVSANRGFLFYFMRQYDRAIAHWTQHTLKMDRNYALAHSYLGMAYVQRSMYQEAIGAFQKAIELSGGAPSNIAALGYTYGLMGDKAKAREQLLQLRRLSKRRFVPAYYVALVHTGLSETDEALDWLDKAYEERAGDLKELKVDPMYDPLRGDPRFAALLQRLSPPAPSGS